jgi:hypothetical protein
MMHAAMVHLSAGMIALLVVALVAAMLLIAALLAAVIIKRRNMHLWLGSYIAQAGKRRGAMPAGGPIHVLLCVADHYEPMVGKPSAEVAMGRVRNWVTEYPRLFGEMRDSDGRPPRHSFFFPIDEYDAAHVQAIADLCRQGFGEVEIHLHHDHDTAEKLAARLAAFSELFRETHGVLPRDRRTGAPRFGFIHGNWALDNSRADGRWCGVNNELDVLRAAGCYADFTLPSAPSTTQTRKINSIYYAVDDPRRPKSHDWGVDVGQGTAPGAEAGGLMLIQGPLVLNWKRRKAGVIPRVENGCIQAGQVPTMARLEQWLRARVQVPSRPDWFFVKLHTHGALEKNQRVLIGEPMVRFHKALAERRERDANFYYHYVTAREMYNLARAAEAGWKGSVADARDFEIVWDTSVATSPPSAAQVQAAGF